jgi:hypothetical protein
MSVTASPFDMLARRYDARVPHAVARYLACAPEAGAPLRELVAEHENAHERIARVERAVVELDDRSLSAGAPPAHLADELWCRLALASRSPLHPRLRAAFEASMAGEDLHARPAPAGGTNDDDALAMLAQCERGDPVGDALDLIDELFEPHAASLARVAPERALALARRLGDDAIEAFLAMAPHLPERLRAAVLDEAAHAARRASNANRRAYGLFRVCRALAPAVAETLLPEAVEAAFAVADPAARVYRLLDARSLVREPRSRDFLEAAVDAASSIPLGRVGARVLAIVPYLGTVTPDARARIVAESFEEILRAMAMDVEGPLLAASPDTLLGALSPWLDSDRWCRALEADLAFRSALYGGGTPDPEPLGLIRCMPPHLDARAALSTLGQLERAGVRSEVLAELAPRLPEGAATKALMMLGREVRERRMGDTALPVLVSLAPKIPVESQHAMVEVAMTLPFVEDRARALRAIAHLLAPAAVDHTYALARAITNPHDCEDALATIDAALREPAALPEAGEGVGVYTQLAATRPRDVIEGISRDLERGIDVTTKVAEVCAVLPADSLLQLWRHALHSAADRDGILERSAHVAPILAQLGGRAAEEQAFAAIESICATWP